MNEPKKFSPADLEECARRELKYRRRVYRSLVAFGKMDQTEADYEIKLMAAIVDHFESMRAPKLL